MCVSRRLDRTTRPTCECRDQDLGRGLLPCPVQPRPPWDSLFSPLVPQEDISIRKLENQHWLCDAGTDRHVWQVGGPNTEGRGSKGGNLASQVRHWQASLPISAGTSCGWIHAQRFLGDWTSAQWKHCMARTEEITSLRWEHPGIGEGTEGGSGTHQAATLHKLWSTPWLEGPQQMAKCLINCEVPCELGHPGKWPNT